ncbi:MAG: PD40 domain-containing protein [Chloroflexi bacterium]|nr:PD40 domain-containing protein [Chloroflexota bacterium]
MKRTTLIILLLAAFLIVNCSPQWTDGSVIATETNNGIVFIAPRGSRPPIQKIIWSPSDENNLLILANETPIIPSEIYVLDIRTQEKKFLIEPLRNAQFVDVEWMPDGEKILLLVYDTTGFEPSGWWSIDVNNKSVERLLDPFDEVAWSPDGSKIVALRRIQPNDPTRLELHLIDSYTNVEESIALYENVDFGSGISWSPDNQYVVFSVSQHGDSNLFILDLKTRRISQITQGFDSVRPRWSPRGNVIAFERKSPDKIGTYLHLISSDGKCMIEIPNLDRAWSPTWSPDGKRIAFLSGGGIYVLETDVVLGRDIYKNLCPK